MTGDDNVFQFPSGGRNDPLVNRILGDDRLNITGRLAWYLTSYSRCRGYVFARRECIIRTLATTEDQFYMSLKSLTRWLYFRKRKYTKCGRTYIEYHPILRDDEELEDFAVRLRNDTRLNLTVRLLWKIEAGTRDRDRLSMRDRDLGVGTETVRRARIRLREFGYIEFESTHGVRPTQYWRTTAGDEPGIPEEDTVESSADQQRETPRDPRSYREKEKERRESKFSEENLRGRDRAFDPSSSEESRGEDPSSTGNPGVEHPPDSSEEDLSRDQSIQGSIQINKRSRKTEEPRITPVPWELRHGLWIMREWFFQLIQDRSPKSYRDFGKVWRDTDPDVVWNVLDGIDPDDEFDPSQFYTECHNQNRGWNRRAAA